MRIRPPYGAVCVLLLMAVWAGSCDKKKSPGEPSCTFAVSASSLAIGSSGGPASVTVTTTSGCAWAASADVSWLAITSGSSGTGSGTVTAVAAANTTTAARVGTLTVAGHAVTVTQAAAGAACTYSVSPPTVSVSRDGGPGTLTVTTQDGCAWTATSAVEWLTIASGAQGAGSGTVGYNVARNDAGASRQTTIAVAGQSIPVVQSGTSAACVASVSPDSAAFDNGGGTGSVAVAAPGSCEWTATSGASWLTIAGAANGNGNGVVSYVVAPNADPAGRETTIDVGGLTVAIAQSGNLSACEYSVAPLDFSPCMNVPFEMTTTVTTSAMCPWTATSDSSWITITRGASGKGTGHIGFTVTDNYDAPRSGQILVRWPTMSAGQNVHVRQAGCTYGVSKRAIGFAAAGGSDSFDVVQESLPNECGGATQNACVWSATTDAPWITITSGHPTVGDGTVRFTVAPNTSPTGRSATIVVRDQTVQITQTGASGSSH